jgi:ribosomal-protein-alanine N-acetyltransferase
MSAVPESGVPRLRPMREHDLSRVAAVEVRSYEFPWTLGIFNDCLRAGYCCWSLIVDDLLVGYGIMAIALDEAHILNLCVDPAHQRRGYAQLILDHLLDLAQRHQASIVFLEVRPSNLAARALYARNGFQQLAVRRAYYPARSGREDAWVLGRTFPPAPSC